MIDQCFLLSIPFMFGVWASSTDIRTCLTLIFGLLPLSNRAIICDNVAYQRTVLGHLIDLMLAIGMMPPILYRV